MTDTLLLLVLLALALLASMLAVLLQTTGGPRKTLPLLACSDVKQMLYVHHAVVAQLERTVGKMF